jgi:hypothetical protein
MTFLLAATSVGSAAEKFDLQGNFLKENKKIGGSWYGGKNFTPDWCSRGFYSARAKFSAVLQTIKMELKEDNKMEITATLSQGYARVDGDYLGDLSGCWNVSGWLGVGTDSLDVRALVTVMEDSPNVNVKVYQVKFGHLRLGRYCPEWLETWLTDSLNKTVVYIWETRLGDWLNQHTTDYFNSLKDKRGI